MLTDEQAVILHHRSALGESLTAEEQAKLDAWYDLQDKLERQSLNLTHREKALTALRQRLQTVLAELATEAQVLSSKNNFQSRETHSSG